VTAPLTTRPSGDRAIDPADVLRLRAWARGVLYREGEIFSLPEAIDPLQEYAKANGLVGRWGQDEVQRVLGDTFGEIA
jgi:hypothetical protein